MALIDMSEIFQMTNDGDHIDGTDVYQSNRNLLDNPWWGSGEAVNQRNTQSKPSNGSYTIDRWILTSGVDANKWAIGANGITFTIASSSIWYTQRTPNPSAWSGKTLTASVLLSDGTIKSGSAAFTYGTAATFYNDSAINLSMNTSGQFVLAIRSTQTIRAVKLELGSVSTLANDATPDYAEELAKCQRYFVRVSNTSGVTMPIGYAVKNSSTNVLVNVATPVELRTVPVSTFFGTHRVFGGGAGSRDISSYSTYGKNAQGVLLLATISSGSLAENEVFAVCAASGAYIDFSADL